jgi:hypothetical protein
MRRPILLIAASLAVLAGADLLACRVLQGNVRTIYTRWAHVMADQGWEVGGGPLEQDGAPFGARLVIPAFSLSGGRAMVPGGLDWHAQRMVLSIGLLHPFRLKVEPQGQQELRLASGPALLIDADTLAASVKLWRGQPDTIDITADSLAGHLQRTPDHNDIRVAELRLHLHATRGGAARTAAQVSIEARGFDLPDNGRWPLGATIGHLAADFTVASPALSGQAAADQARAWRDWGGALTLEHLALRWGPLDMDVRARMGLDDKLQPAGTGTARLDGWSQSLDALASGGTVTQGVAQTAKVILGSLAPADGSALVLPFTLRDSTVSVGKVPVMRVQTIAWGGV